MTDKPDVVSEEEEERAYEAAFEEEWGDAPTDETDKPEEAEAEDDELGEAEEEVETPNKGIVAESDGKEDDDKPAHESDSSNKNNQFAWIEDLPEEVKEQAEALRHTASSNQGRVAAYNRQLLELRQEVARLNSEVARAPGASKADGTAEDAPKELPEKFQQLKEDFPEFAEAVEAIREHDRTQFQTQIDETLQPLEEARVAQKRQDFEDKVSSGAEEIFDTENTGIKWQDVAASEDFVAWLSLQPKSVQSAARIEDPVEALYVLGRYEEDYQREAAARASGSGNSPTKEVPSDSQPNKADKLKQRRDARKAKAVAPESSPAASSQSGEGGDYEAMFNAQWG